MNRKKMLCGNQTLTGLLYLLTHARKIDWLNVYHGGRHCYYWIKLYKLLNPKGKVYLKLDLSYAGCEMYQNSEKKERNIFEKTAAVSDIVSVESKKIKKLTAEFTKQNIRVVPNGYINEAETIPQVNREKQFITVGRLGTPEKATDILLEAFAQSANSHDWTLKLVGSVAQDFQTWLEDFYNRYPEIKERIIFTGPIYEREALYRGSIVRQGYLYYRPGGRRFHWWDQGFLEVLQMVVVGIILPPAAKSPNAGQGRGEEEGVRWGIFKGGPIFKNQTKYGRTRSRRDSNICKGTSVMV